MGGGRAVGTLSTVNARLYRDWQRARAGEGFADLPRNRTALESLEASADGRPLDQLTRDDILNWVGGMDGIATSSRLTYWSSARAFYNWASSAEEGIIERSPMDKMKAPKDPPRPVPIPHEDHVRALIAAAEKDRTPMGTRDAAMIRLLADTGGPRASELAGLLIAGRPHPQGTAPGLGVDLDHDTVTVAGKGGKIRTWPMSARTGKAAARWLRLRDRTPKADRHARLWLPFSGPVERPVTYSGVEAMLERRCAAAGIPAMHPHQLRHFSYHHFLLAGGQLNDAKMLYGWDDDQMPARYARQLAGARAVKAGHALAIGDQW